MNIVDKIHEELNTKKHHFHPINPVEGKNNYKLMYIIEKDGTIREKIFLSFTDSSERELVICLHYLRFIVKHFFSSAIGINIIDRDNPWDFKLELNNKDSFNLEITSISDNSELFKINKNQERLNSCYQHKTIRLRELKKLNSLFNSDESNKLLINYETQNISLDDKVSNPYYQKDIIPISNLPKPPISLKENIKKIIRKKLEKNHMGKENTVLIIDNRTSAYDLDDYYHAIGELNSFIKKLPFPEIWFYTGFYSDNSGMNADYMFSPIKTTNKQNTILQKLSINANSNGEIIWEG